MSKVLRTAAVVVGAVALVATGLGAAAGAGIIGVGAGSTATVFGVSAATLTAVGTFASIGALALSTVASLMAKKPTSGTCGSHERFAVDPGGLWPLWTGCPA